MTNIIVDLWNSFLYIPILNLLIAFYHLFFNNMGLAIIAITILIKVVSFPLTKPSIEAAKKQRELKPELDKLKLKYKNKQVFAQKQMELFKKHGINPIAGCLPQIINLIVIIALYQVFRHLLEGNGIVISEINNLLYNINFLKFADNSALNNTFIYLDLAQKDPYYVLPILAGGSQFILSKYMMQPAQNMEKAVKNTSDKKDDIMYNMQQQMTYMMPIMTVVIGLNLPSGLVLYWLVSTIIAVGQYYLLNGKTTNTRKN